MLKEMLQKEIVQLVLQSVKINSYMEDPGNSLVR